MSDVVPNFSFLQNFSLRVATAYQKPGGRKTLSVAGWVRRGSTWLRLYGRGPRGVGRSRLLHSRTSMSSTRRAPAVAVGSGCDCIRGFARGRAGAPPPALREELTHHANVFAVWIFSKSKDLCAIWVSSVAASLSSWEVLSHWPCREIVYSVAAGSSADWRRYSRCWVRATGALRAE
jgi:hypothetical protein